MKLTNRHGLPAPIVAAARRFISTRPPQRRVIRQSSLRDSPQVRILTMQHFEEIEEDVSEMVWALWGHLTHAVLESHAADELLSEETLRVRYGDWIVTGTADLYERDTKRITDYKTTSAWRIVRSGGKCPPDWEKQANIYAELFRQRGDEVESLQVVAMLRDWSETERDNGEASGKYYPPSPIIVIDVPLWPADEADRYIRERIALHELAEDGHPVRCSDEERWMSDPSFAVMREGTKRAVAVRATEEDARAALEEQSAADAASKRKRGALYIEARPGSPRRCERYCAVSRWCSQYSEWLASKTDTGGF